MGAATPCARISRSPTSPRDERRRRRTRCWPALGIARTTIGLSRSHTAVTWALLNGAHKWQAAEYFRIALDMLEPVYGQHHPDYLQSAVEAMDRKW